VIVLVCNDDGIRAAGIQALAAALSDLGEVWVVAPDREQSAVSHALSLHRPLRADRIADRQFAVDGTPTDCIILAVSKILPEKPALLVSGINHGGNMGDDVSYSGTVSAAVEGTLLGIPSIAVSLVTRGAADFGAAATFANRLGRSVLEQGMAPDTLLNVNVPAIAVEDIRGYAVTRQGKRRYGDAIVENVDPRGRTYYWIGGDDLGYMQSEGSDCTAVESGYISVTPLHLDMTNYQSIARVGDMKVDWP
jgi:5'-nucleotidase